VKSTFINKLYSIHGLLLTAFLFFSLSFIFNKIYSGKTSVKREVDLLEKYINKYRRSFDKLVNDTQLIKKLVTGEVEKNELEKLANDKFGIYLFYEDGFDSFQPKFWNNQQAFPELIDADDKDGESFDLLSNGYYVRIKKTITLPGVNRKVIAYSLIAIASKYFIETGYLPREFYYRSGD